MASRARVEEYRELNAGIVELAQRDLDAFLARLDLTDVAVTRAELVEFTDALVQTYGQPAALVAAQFYDDLRAASPNAKGRYSAIMADPPSRAQIEGTVRWAVGEPDVKAALSGGLQRFISDAGRNTIAYNSYRDPSPGGWARVPGFSRSGNCGFCLMLASRGPVYRSAATAGEGNRYHDHCNCVPTQIWDGDSLPDGYDPDALYDEYQEARAVADSGDSKAITAVLDAGRVR